MYSLKSKQEKITYVSINIKHLKIIYLQDMHGILMTQKPTHYPLHGSLNNAHTHLQENFKKYIYDCLKCLH